MVNNHLRINEYRTLCARYSLWIHNKCLRRSLRHLVESSAELSTLDIPTDFLIGARKAVCAAQAT